MENHTETINVADQNSIAKKIRRSYTLAQKLQALKVLELSSEAEPPLTTAANVFGVDVSTLSKWNM